MNVALASCLLALVSSLGNTSHDLDAARTLFARFQELGAAFDPALAELYCDNAVIRNTRTYPFGFKRELELSGEQFKSIVRSVMPLAKARGDISTFSEMDFLVEQGGIRINASRHSVLKGYDSPFSLLVGRCGDLPWAIIEEIGQSRP